MLYMSWLVHKILKLVLVNVAELYPDIIHKDSSITQAFPQEDFQLGQDKEHQDFSFYLPLILLSLVQNFLFKKYIGIKNLVIVSRPKCGKIVLAQLDEVIIIHMQFTLLNIWGPGWISPLWGVFGGFSILAKSLGLFCI